MPLRVKLQEIVEALIDALDGRGAFRMFRTVLKRARKEDEWYRFRENAFVATVKKWLDEHGIAYE